MFNLLLFSLHLHHLHVSNESLWITSSGHISGISTLNSDASVSFQCLPAVTNHSASVWDPFWRKTGKFLSPDKTQACLHGWISPGTAQTYRQVCTRFFSCCRKLSYASTRSCILADSLGTSCRRHKLKRHLIRTQMQKAVISGSLKEA